MEMGSRGEKKEGARESEDWRKDAGREQQQKPLRFSIPQMCLTGEPFLLAMLLIPAGY